jgi:hypothetical protein
MNADKFVHAGELGGAQGVIDPHCEEITDRENREAQPCPLAHEFHVQGQRRVAGVVKISIGAFDDESAGIAAVGTVRH